MIKKTLNQFKKTVLVLCSLAVLTPSISYANTGSFGQDDNSTDIATYAYDAFGRRIAKTVHGSTTYYIYSGNQLIAELDESGEMVKAYGWDLNDESNSPPLWQAEVTDGRLDTAEYHTLINDHLGTPQMAVNDEGDVTWRAVSESFGKTIPHQQNQITMNLRFPGQYYDEETGTHYNYFRDYNPVAGRYIQKDPIGLWGGINEYGYVHGNPLKYTDPKGLVAPLVIIAGWGAAEWGMAGLVSLGLIGTGLAINENLQQNGGYGDPTVPPFPIYVPPPTVPPTHTIPDEYDCPPNIYTKNPDTAAPGSIIIDPIPGGQERRYGPDGAPEKDIDHHPDHGAGTPHVHDWTPNPSRPGRPGDRSPGRPLRPGETIHN